MTKMNSVYFSEIERIPLLTQEEEKTLATKAFSGEKEDQKKLVEHNLRFVVKIANQYKGYMDIEDLVAEGNMGLMHAAEKFNPSEGCKFATYAVFWIKAYIQKAIRETSTGIRFPANQFKEMKKSKWKIASLDKALNCGDDEETTLASFLKDGRVMSPEEEFLKKTTVMQLKKLMETLKDNEQLIIEKRYGMNGTKPESLAKIGTVMGFSKERVRQIEKHALLKLRNTIENDEEYADLAA